MVDCAPVAEKSTILASTTYGAIVRAQLKRSDQIESGRQFYASIALVCLSLGWVGVLVATKHANDALPWVVSFLISACSTGVWFFLARSPSSLSIFKIGESRWTSLASTLALTLSLFSAVLGAWILTHGMPDLQHIEVKRQVIDIILVSPNDYEDRHDLLPSTKPTNVPAREVTVQGKPNIVLPSIKAKPLPTPVAPKPLLATTTSANAKSFNNESTLSRQKMEALPEPSFVLRQPTPPPASQNRKLAKVTQPKIEAAQPVLEEVAPAQMFEVTDSPNEKASEVSQSGGHSSGGTGSQTLLVSYLRDVHRRIKKAWTPGSDDATSSAQIMFRIRKNGRLISMKLVHSSGESETDQSAMHAVTASAPFKPLPNDFPADYLDLLYTFNYKVDSLSEVPPPQLE